MVEFLPEDAEALGLLALMLHLEARREARRDEDGEFVPLGEQEVSRWHGGLIEEAERVLAQASRMGRVGRYQLEAAVQSAHAIRRLGVDADWAALERLYARLLELTGSPVVAINRAVVIAELEGPRAGLAALAAIGADPRLVDYQPFWAARAEIFARCGEPGAAGEAYERAISLEPDPSVRRFLEKRRARFGT